MTHAPPYLNYWIDQLPEYLVVSESDSSAAWYYAQYDSGYMTGPHGGGASWSIDSTAASIDPTSAHATTVSGEDADLADYVTVTADLGMQDRYGWDGLNCYYNYTEQMTAQTSFALAGISNAAMYEAQEFADDTANFLTIDPCNVTCKASGAVRMPRGCPHSMIAYKYRTQYWVRNGIGPKICLNIAGYGVTYSGFCHPTECFETILAP